MSRPLLISIGLLLLGFCSGIGVGLYLGGSELGDASKTENSRSTSESSSETEGQQRIEANTVLADRIRELEKELGSLEQSNATNVKNRLEFFRKYRNQGLFVSGFETYSPKDVKLNDVMVDVLELSRDERTAVEEHLTQAKNAMVSLEDSNTTIVDQTPTSITYEKPQEPGGKAIKDQLSQELANDIGADRANFLLDYGDFASPTSMFSDFGAQKTDIQVSWTTSPSGKQLYTWKLSNSNGSSWNDTPSDGVPNGLKKYLPTTPAQ